MADRALRVAAGHGVAGRRLLHVLEFGFGEVDGHRQPVRVEARVPVELGTLDIIVGHTVVVEPLHGGHAAIPVLDEQESVVEISGVGGEDAHDGVGVGRAFLRLEKAGGCGGGAEGGEQGVGGLFAIGGLASAANNVLDYV